MNRRSIRIIAGSLVAAILLATGLLLWRRSQTLMKTGEQAFVFESHPRVLQVGGKRPVVAATVTGGLYLLSVENTDSALTLRMSHDGGEHWMPPTALSSPGAVVTTSAENAPQLVARGMYAFALWQEKNEIAGTQLRVARSSGMDAKSPGSTPVTDKPATDKSYSGFASLAVAPNGDVYAVWLDGRDNTSAASGTFNVYLARSTDHGVTFHRNVKVATLACPCCRPSVAISSDGKIYVAYRHVYSDNERDVAVATSTDAGEHFSDPVRVAADRWKIFGCPESGPVVALQGEKLIVSWYTATGEQPGIRLAASRDGGRSFSREIVVSNGIQSANHPFLASRDDGTIAIAFSGRLLSQTGTWEEVTPFVFRIDTRGHLSAVSRVPADEAGDRYPTLSLAPDGDAYVVWRSVDAAKVSLVRAVSR
ncbi:MAG TPA: sialidase family protein [Edaphobacter sp.]|nr:sialidase family protein [Edaphobacter sp.]